MDAAAENQKPETENQKPLFACDALFSLSLHGLLLGAFRGVPVCGPATETGALEFLSALGMQDAAIKSGGGSFDAAAALNTLRELASKRAHYGAQIQAKMAGLKKKEHQNARMLELLVPRRVMRERAEQASDSLHAPQRPHAMKNASATSTRRHREH